MTRSSGMPIDAATLAELDRVWSTWAHSSLRQDAIRMTEQVHGYNPVDVALQLDRVATRCASTSLDACSKVEQDRWPDLASIVPERVLHVAASTIPGLVVESICHTLALGSDVMVRPSSRECVLAPWREHLQSIRSPLAERIAVCTTVPSAGFDAAVVFGTDATVEAIRARLHEAAGAGAPLAEYGSRAGIALIDAGACDDPEAWHDQVCSDIGMFLQRGCMSPSHVLVVGDVADADREGVRSLMQQGMARALRRHQSHDTHQFDALARRSAMDAETLDQLFDASRVAAGPLSVRLEFCPHDAALSEQLEHMRTVLQTAVIVAATDMRRNELSEIAEHAGCSRVCNPGQAHDQAADWPHDGIGWFAPLLGTEVSQTR